jgi:hypothetical protein
VAARRNFGVLNEADPVQFPVALSAEFQAVLKPRLAADRDPYLALLEWVHAVSDRTVEACGGCPTEAIGKGAFAWWKERLAEDWSAKAPEKVKPCRHRHQPPCADDVACTARYMGECRAGVAV